MRHGISGRKLNRTSAHRKALFSNLAQALVHHEQIVTTLPKAKELRPIVEKMVTLGKKGGLSEFRRLISSLHNERLADKLVKVLGPRYAERQGGYTRIIRCGYRYGDNAPLAVIEFVDRDLTAKGTEETSAEEITETSLAAG